jgi:guanine deaminase
MPEKSRTPRNAAFADSDPRFMREAIRLARRGMRRGDGGPFGAVIVRNGEIIGKGWNRVLRNLDPTAHGEITAIRAACRRIGSFSLSGCVIHTTGQPCPMCLGAIHWARISRIHYGFDAETAARIGFDDRKFLRAVAKTCSAGRLGGIRSSPLCREEAEMLACEYAALPDRRPY